MKKKIKLKQEDKIIADVDDAIHIMTCKIQKKYKLSWGKARDSVNYALRILMLSYPDKWLKK